METIMLAHGGGGQKTTDLICNKIRKYFNDPLLGRMDDGAVIDKLVFTTDSFVVKPLFFPGGNIGSLAVHGTTNDLAMCGARPQWLSLAFVLEEGLLLADLWRVVSSIREACEPLGVRLVTKSYIMLAVGVVLLLAARRMRRRQSVPSGPSPLGSSAGPAGSDTR